MFLLPFGYIFMKKLLSLILVLLSLIGCAPTTIKFDAVANPNMRTIGLVELLPRQHMVLQSDTAERLQNVLGGGLIGGVLTASLEQKESGNILTEEINKSGFDFSRQMTAELAKALQNAGYEVVTIPPNEIEIVKRGVRDVDAYLTMVCTYPCKGVGYRYDSASSEVVSPYILGEIRLASTFDKLASSPLYLSKVAYGDACSSCYNTITPPARYHFDITKPENRTLLIEGLQAGIVAIAERVATDLRK
jgi:hypothetical protein